MLAATGNADIEDKREGALVFNGVTKSLLTEFSVDALMNNSQEALEGKNRTIEDGALNLSQSELHSIAVFCQHSDCQSPKEVSGYLLREDNSARVSTVILFAICFGLFGILFWIGFMTVGIADNSFFISVVWLFRGMGYVPIFLIFLSSLAVAVNGYSSTSAAAILAVVVYIGGCAAVIWILNSPRILTNFIRGAVIFLGEFVFFSTTEVSLLPQIRNVGNLDNWIRFDVLTD